jgi:cobalt-zinc-cadmium efflux system protein
LSRHETRDAYLRYRTGLSISLAVVAIQAIVLSFTAWGISSAWSIGLFEDTMHGIADNLVLIGAVIVLYFEAHGATPNKGRKRILALVGGAILVASGFAGGWFAYQRIVGIQAPLSGWVIAVTSLVAVIGGVSAYLVIHGVHKDMHDHLHNSAVSHLVGDLAISVAVLVSSVGIIFFDFPAIDSWMAIPVSLWMIWRGGQVLKYKDPTEFEAHQHSHDEHHH